MTACRCHEQTEQAPTIHSISWDHLVSLSNRNVSLLSQQGISITAPQTSSVSQLHIGPDGGFFLTTPSVSDLQGSVVLSGTIGSFPVELRITVQLANDTVTVTLEVDKPIKLGPFTWTHKLGGIARDGKQTIVGAQSISLSPETEAFPAAGFGSHLLCILKCAGLAILPILVSCLPSFATGPQAFIACVIGKAGTAAAAIATCFVKCATA